MSPPEDELVALVDAQLDELVGLIDAQLERQRETPAPTGVILPFVQPRGRGSP